MMMMCEMADAVVRAFGLAGVQGPGESGFR